MSIIPGSKFYSESILEISDKYGSEDYLVEEEPNGKCCGLCRNREDGQLLKFITKTEISERKEWFHKECLEEFLVKIEIFPENN